METGSEQQTQVAPVQTTSFSVSPNKKASGSKWIIIFIVLLILGGAGIFFFTKSDSETAEATPTPNVRVDVKESTPTPSPIKSPEAIKRSDISIVVQNGTGVSGEAAFLQGKLKELGYSDITAKTADSTDYTVSTVTFNKSLSQTAQDEIKKLLEDTYKEVTTKSSSTQSDDVVIITGLRGTQTSKASASPTAKSSATPKASGSATPSATPKATATGN